MRPVLASTREELAKLLADARAGDTRVAFVPTMGALHEGHASLMRVARERVGAGPVVVSIFVNPMQFGPTEDLDRYPRTLDADLEVCGREGVDVVFAPSVEEVYPHGLSTGSTSDPSRGVTIEPGALATVLEGETRPGHFAGVLTVVAKLFGLVQPDVAVFGQKDYQQLALIRRMVEDLCMPVEVVGAETVREPDGLAMSSRNRYLDPEQRRVAATLSRALRAAQDRASYGVPAARWAAMSVLKAEPGLELDYLALTSPDLGEAPETGEGRILVAARVGTTRLIDNMPITFEKVPSAREASPTGRERREADLSEPVGGPAKPVTAIPTNEASI
ncbi:pantoate--beta-alanine ligase [Nocardioides gansuensis]|uniref:Pantothenate synthetase n=1 Tax=Nocardioides gansuensis TaxID=2138300 RepID=A0A2T8F9Q8_9ACTN|nr:pantoate--beta-alanine ligase [Nocardioides gansuensis]PVG82468.1 pantoate--beta-alanine ligase [Nocardioides gansuensis]